MGIMENVLGAGSTIIDLANRGKWIGDKEPRNRVLRINVVSRLGEAGEGLGETLKD